MNLMDNSSEKWNEKGIKLYPILIEEVDRKEYKKEKGNYNLKIPYIRM